MTITPSTQSGFLSGLGVSALLWGIILKFDALAKLVHLNRLISSERILDWITDNKALFIVLLESINVLVHGVNNAAAISVALGIAAFNSFVVFVCLPFRSMLRKTHNLV